MPRRAKVARKGRASDLRRLPRFRGELVKRPRREVLQVALLKCYSATNALGCGRQRGYQESYRGVDIEVNLLKKVRVEIAVNDDFAAPTVAAIVQGAKTGQIGDGKIFVLDLPECIRIRTGERGGAAIG